MEGRKPNLGDCFMLGASIIRHVRQAAARFAGANEGNVAVIFTIAAIPIIGFVGAAIDYTRVNQARSSMQSALDSAALMLSKDLSSGKITASEVNSSAQSYFSGLFNQPDANSVTVSSVYNPDNGNMGSTITLNGSGNINTDFLKVLGLPSLNFSSSSTTAWGNVKMRVALALDNTGSMADNGKITALRNAVAASGGLIDQLSGLAKNPGDVLISVIPFAKVVNVGSSNSNASWIDWGDWLNPPTAQPNNNLSTVIGVGSNYEAMLPSYWHALGPGMTCPFTTSNAGFTCTNSPTSRSTTTTIPSSGYICPSIDYNSHTLYNGCWTSTATGTTGVFCSGSTNCQCPRGSATSGSSACICTGSGSGRSCKAPLYDHEWTQPNDATHNLSQPRVTAYTGFANRQWSATTHWQQAYVSKSAPTQSSSNATIPWQSVDPVFDSTVAQNAVQNTYAANSTNPITTWTGCVTDRDGPNQANYGTVNSSDNYDAQGNAPSSNNTVTISHPSTLFPANEYDDSSSDPNGVYQYCNQSNSTVLEPLQTLSDNWSTLKSMVNAMQPTGGTNQAVGLAWAWQSLLTTSPIPAPAEDPNYTYNRVIIILSDGLNTEDRWPAYGNGNTQNTTSGTGDIDARQTLLCQNLKSQIDPTTNLPMYTIYTIQVDTSNPADPTSQVLYNCASDPSKFFLLTSSNQIVTTFNTIGNSLSQLRVAR
jgi:Flp pilus assembly protein TadG